MNVTYDKQIDTETRNIGNLAITLPVLEQMNLRNIVNQHLPTSSGREPDIDHGTIVELMTAARLSGPCPLSRIGPWAAQSGAEMIYQIDSSQLNDDRLGRTLDQLFTVRHSVLASLSLHISERFNVPLDKLHYDPTHLFFTGCYNGSTPRERLAVQEYDVDGIPVVLSDEELAAVNITKGKPLDDAPTGCRMIHLGVATAVDEHGPIPMFAHAMDGNENGRTGIEEFMGLTSKHLRPKKLLCISDRGTHSAAHLRRAKEQGFEVICSLPWREVSDLFDQQYNTLDWYEASYLSQEQRRRREAETSLPLEHYQIASTTKVFYDKVAKESSTARVIFVYSTADAKVVAQQRVKQLTKIEMQLEKCQTNVSKRGPYSDIKSVKKRMAKLLDKSSLGKYVEWSMVELTAKTSPKTPVAGKGNRIPTHEFCYTVDYCAIENEKQYDGYSAIVTNLDDQESCDDEVFSNFKNQIYSELVNRTLKNPKQLAVRPVFLHTPERVEALAFLMIIALMTHFLIQREYRKDAAVDQTLDVPQGAPATKENRLTKANAKSERKMTTDRIFRDVVNYTVIIEQSDDGYLMRPTKPDKSLQRIIKRLGIESPAKFLRRKLEASIF